MIASLAGRERLGGEALNIGQFRGDKPADNGDNRGSRQLVFLKSKFFGKSPVTVSGKTVVLKTVVLMAAIAGAMLTPAQIHAQWWSARAPADFEECAEHAEKAASAEAKASQLSECNAKFAGRRKPGGGYTYFDFMQNRTFDLAGPNPTPDEQKQIDEQYTVYLDQQRQSVIAAAFAAKQQQLQQASFRSEPVKPPAVAEAPGKPPASTGEMMRARAKATSCAKHSFSCDWPRLSEGIKDLKKVLFGSSSSKAKRG